MHEKRVLEYGLGIYIDATATPHAWPPHIPTTVAVSLGTTDFFKF